MEISKLRYVCRNELNSVYHSRTRVQLRGLTHGSIASKSMTSALMALCGRTMMCRYQRECRCGWMRAMEDGVTGNGLAMGVDGVGGAELEGAVSVSVSVSR